MALAAAQGRHEKHWLDLLGEHAEPAIRPSLRNQFLGLLAARLGSVFALALAQRSESRSPYADDATAAMAADESIHEEVIRGLSARGRNRLSGSFRAAVVGLLFGTLIG